MVLSYSSAARQGAAQKVSGPPTTEGVIAGPVRPATPPSVPAPSVPEEETQPIAGPSRLFPSAPEPPFADSSPTGPTITHLILDAGPLLSLEPVRHLASTFHTTPLVLAELKDPKARAHWDALALSGVDVRVEMPSAAAMGKVMEFAKKTGDYAVLSQTDLSVLALTCHWEMELNGDERIRKAPGEKLTPRDEVGAVGVQAVAIQAEGTAAEVAELPVGEEAGPEATTQVATATGEAGEQEGGEGSNGQEEAGSDDDSGGEWITTANVKRHRNRDLGLLPGGGKSGSKPLAAACMTGDYAVQNVLLGMGLGLVGEGGKRISKVKSWVLRCHACFKLCRDPSKRFCPSCGNASLMRTSVSTSATTGKQHVHLKKNFQYNVRGTVYSIPDPKPGRAKGQLKGGSGLILREDQAEWQDAVKTEDRRKAKEEKRMMKNDGQMRWDDPDWLPELITVGNSGKGRTFAPNMPAIGHGRKNPNQARRKR